MMNDTQFIIFTEVRFELSVRSFVVNAKQMKTSSRKPLGSLIHVSPCPLNQLINICTFVPSLSSSRKSIN
jgi:hypothetical protein